MSLTLEAEQRLESGGLVKLFEADKSVWTKLAKQTYDFLKSSFPAHSRIRPDDVHKALRPLLEVNKKLVDYLSGAKLKQKYWVDDFADLIIDRTWNEIAK